MRLPISAGSLLIKLKTKINKMIFKSVFVALFLCFMSFHVHAQDNANQSVKQPSSGSSAGASAAKVPLVIVGSAAKGTWVTTKVTTKYVVAPVAKEVFLEATPAMAKFAAKNVLKYGVPIAAKWVLL